MSKEDAGKEMKSADFWALGVVQMSQLYAGDGWWIDRGDVHRHVANAVRQIQADAMREVARVLKPLIEDVPQQMPVSCFALAENLSLNIHELANKTEGVEGPSPKFKVRDRVRVNASVNDEYVGLLGVIKSAPHGAWDYGVRLDKRWAFGVYGFSEKELEASGEKPAPKFKMGEPVWVKKGVGAEFAEKVALVSESRYEPSGKWAYKVWIPLGGGPGREYGWYFEDSLEAIDMRGKDE